MGWGEPHTPVPPSAEVVAASRRLADAVRRWNGTRTVRDEEAMVDALEAYDRAVQDVNR